MPDIVDAQTRSRMMAGIKSMNTQPELIIRKGLHAIGFRYRLHVKQMPGKPDIVFPRYKAVIFVNGCFWHGHDCSLFRMPKTRSDFWKAKLATNKARDLKIRRELSKTGWRSLIVWECAIRGQNLAAINKVIMDAADWLRSGKADCDIRGADYGTR